MVTPSAGVPLLSCTAQSHQDLEKAAATRKFTFSVGSEGSKSWPTLPVAESSVKVQKKARSHQASNEFCSS